MFPIGEVADKKKMSMGSKEIEKLPVCEECMAELKAMHGELENKISVGDKTSNEELTKEKDDMDGRKEAAKQNITAVRNRVQMCRTKEFLIDLTHPPGEAELQQKRFAAQFQETGNELRS